LTTSSKILLQSSATVAAEEKSVMPAQEQLQAELDIQPLQKTAIQFKLAIGAPDDPLEHEADAMADTIMRMPEQNFIQRKCAECEEEEKVQRKPLASFIQRKGSSAGTVASDAISNKINASKGSGSNMDSHTQSFMQSRFGADFSDVKIHTGNESTQLNRELGAKAFTVGNDIYFNEEQFNPNSSEGKHLLAHELTHTVQQGNSSNEWVSRKCDVDMALHYYNNTTSGKKINCAEWLEKLKKVVGKDYESLYVNAQATGIIDEAFVLLVCKSQELLNISVDGKIGVGTQKAFETFTTGGEKGIDYTKLFMDKKLEVGIAIGDEFKSEFISIVALLEAAGPGEKNFSSTGTAERKLIKFTKEFPVQGDNTAAPVAIDIVFDIICSESATPKETFTEFLSQKEIAIYSGHARYGTGPDFDSKESVKENFIIGVNSALHKAGKLTAGYDEHMNQILEGQANDLEAMSKAGKIDPDTYQVWFFNACSTLNYLDEVRKGLVTDNTGQIKSKANLRFVGTKYSIYSDAVKIVKAILDMQNMDEIISIMDANENEEVKRHNETPKKNYYFSD
jgi:Domain of unknown function (DUF4157)